MAYLGSWKIDDYLPIPVTTHKFSTGAAYAPTSLTYSIYEDGGTTGLDEDVDMVVASPFDSVVGFYLARRQLTAAAGFEKGKNYTVLIKATVDSVAAIAAHTFQIEAEVDSNVVSGTVATVTNLTNAPTDMAKESTLTAIKGATWSDETLVALMTAIEGISAGSGASVADILNALLASYTVSGSVGESLGRLDNIQAKTDLITTGTTLSIANAVVGSTITAHRGDTLSAALEDIGALTNYSKIWFTVKRDFEDADSASIVQIEKTGGLLYINGAAGTAAYGSLTINDEATGDITIVLNASETAKLGVGSYQYDIQVLRSAGTPVSTLTYGEFIVDADVTKATA